jgi:hypothetical protein
VRRLEALASAGRVQREGAGLFRIGADYEAVATAHETL